MKVRKAQLSTEFIIVFGVILVIVISMLAITDDKNKILLEYEKRLDAKTLANNFALQINKIIVAGNTSTTTFTFPDALNRGLNYSIKTSGSNVEIMWETYRYTAPLISDTANSQSFSPGLSTIYNNGGTIEFS